MTHYPQRDFYKKPAQKIRVGRLVAVIGAAFVLGFGMGYATKTAFAREGTPPESAPIIIRVYEAPAAAEQPAEESKVVYKPLDVVTTAYCPCAECCDDSADGITSTGTVATEGRTIAVDPSVIPYGTQVIIDGITYVAEDCGGAIKGNRIDIFFNSHADALQYGKQQVRAFVKGVS